MLYADEEFYGEEDFVEEESFLEQDNEGNDVLVTIEVAEERNSQQIDCKNFINEFAQSLGFSTGMNNY